MAQIFYIALIFSIVVSSTLAMCFYKKYTVMKVDKTGWLIGVETTSVCIIAFGIPFGLLAYLCDFKGNCYPNGHDNYLLFGVLFGAAGWHSVKHFLRWRELSQQSSSKQNANND